MAKFSGPSVTPGQPGSIQLPTEQIGEQIPTTQPQQTGTFIDDVAAAASLEDVQAGIQAGAEAEIETAQQQERERVPTLKERQGDTTTVHRWDPMKQPATPRSDGGMAARATNMVGMFGGGDPSVSLGITPVGQESRAAALAGDTSAVADIAAEGTPGSLTAALNRSGAVTTSQRADNTWANKVDDTMLMVGSVVTERMFSDAAFGDTEGDIRDIDPESQAPTISKAQGNAALGQEIHREYSRLKNQAAGAPTDQYADLPREEANTLGDAFKEMWAQANPELVRRDATPGGQTVFQLTPLGIEKMKESAPTRKRLFPKQVVRPAKAPTQSGQLPGEHGRTVVKRKTGKVKQPLAGAQVLQEATRNLNSVANVVDPQRLRVLYTTILPVLAGQLDFASWEATINNIGEKQMQKFVAAEARYLRDPQGDPYSAADNMADLQNKVAQEVRAIAQERKGVNHLTYQIQAATGRIDPQQLHFNPTTSKAVRFVTRNVVPAKATPGSRIARNLEQMYAMMLIKGADSLLPDGRLESFKENEQKLEAWGDRLSQLLDESMTADQAEAISQAIEEGIPLTDPNFPPFNTLGLDPGTDADLIRAIKDKGEDGPHFIDGLIDAANYIKAKRDGRPYHSYFNAYVDGKTNGIASNGIQMGSEQIARATGVIRDNTTELLDDGDIRDALQANLIDRLDTDGFDGALKDEAPELYDVARTLFGTRQLNKDTTMTFSYGKEMGSFINDIQTHLDLNYEALKNDPESTYAQSLDSLRQSMGEDVLAKTLLNFYTGSLANVLSNDAIQSRALVRSAGLLFALTDQLFTIESATGFDLSMGGERAAQVNPEDLVRYTLGGKRLAAGQHQTYSSSAAAKRRAREEGVELDYGGVVHGQSVTSPVQSLDAATVALSAAGKSWDKMKSASNGNPYMHTIYDAFKFDAMGFDVGVQEVNKNWLDSTMNWSYLEETHKATQAAMDTWNKETQQVPQDTPVDIGPNGKYVMMGYLLDMQKNKQGKMEPTRLINKFKKLLDVREGEDVNAAAYEAARRVFVDLKGVGVDPRNLGEQVTMKQLRTFVRSVARELDTLNRISRMAKKTNANKQALRKKINRVENYQYYAH